MSGAVGVIGVTSHAAARMAERYGLMPTDAEWRQVLLLDIWESASGNGPCMLMGRDERGIERRAVQVGGIACLAVYSPEKAMIITFLSSGVMHRPHRTRQSLRGRERRERQLAEVWE